MTAYDRNICLSLGQRYKSRKRTYVATITKLWPAFLEYRTDYKPGPYRYRTVQRVTFCREWRQVEDAT